MSDCVSLIDRSVPEADELQPARHQSDAARGQSVFDWFRESRRAPRGENDLSEREIEVVCLLAQGLAAKQAAGRLGIACKTVNNHRQNAMRKLGLRSRAEVVLYAVRSGMVRL